MRGRIILGMLLVALLPAKSMAQDDDLYFTPKDEPVEEPAIESVPMAVEPHTYYIGSNRDVDEYNRQGRYWQHYQKIGTDSLGNDIIEFSEGRGVYPDSLQIAETYVEDDRCGQEDFQYTSLFCRLIGFYDPWLYSHYGFVPYYWNSIYWHWYDPWYYGYWGWYDPWYYGYWGWYGSW